MNAVSSLLGNTKAVQIQFFLSLFLITLYGYTITDSDINLFDGYVLRVISDCWPGNNSEQCVKARADLGCAGKEDQQMCLGDRYWMQVNKHSLLLALILSLGRAIPSIVRHWLGTRKFTFATFFEIIWYGGMALTIFFTGVIDLFYYLLRGRLPDAELPWLNKVGLFNITKQFGSNPEVVESGDLYITFLIGIVGIVAWFFAAMYVYRTYTTLKKDIA